MSTKSARTSSPKKSRIPTKICVWYRKCYARGFEFLPLDIYKSEPHHFQIVDGKLLPALNTIDGLGDNAAVAIAEAAKDGFFLSKDDFRERTKVSKTTIELMSDLGIVWRYAGIQSAFPV